MGNTMWVGAVSVNGEEMIVRQTRNEVEGGRYIPGRTLVVADNHGYHRSLPWDSVEAHSVALLRTHIG